jgi:hypothetical protein
VIILANQIALFQQVMSPASSNHSAYHYHIPPTHIIPLIYYTLCYSSNLVTSTYTSKYRMIVLLDPTNYTT